MTQDEKTALVNAHLGYIRELISLYNSHIGIGEYHNLSWLEPDYKNAMMAGLNGEQCPKVNHYLPSKFQIFNIKSAWEHGIKHAKQESA